MSGNEKEIAGVFWKNTKTYPDYGNIKNRRLYELNYLVPNLEGKTLLDLGCGDGALTNCLLNLTEFEKFYAYDLSEQLLSNVHPLAITKVFDCYKDDFNELPKVDCVIIGGMIQYIFEDNILEELFSSLKTKKIFVRSTCSNNERQIINTFSEKLNSNYSSIYRTTDEVVNLMSKHFEIESVDRIYPDEIESLFGTKQYYFKGVSQS